MSTDTQSVSVSPLLLIPVGLLLFAIGWTAMNFRGGVADAEDLDSRSAAVGTVVDCVEVGPVGLSGVGYWWRCEVAVRTDDGDTYTQNFGGSEFTPADVGRTFPLASAGMHAKNWSRADVDSNTWAVVLTAVGLISGIIAFGVGARNLRRK